MIEIIKEIYPFLVKHLCITILVEELAIVFLREKNKKIYIACFIINIFSNLTLNILLQLFSEFYIIVIVVLEIVVIIIESLVYYLINKDLVKSVKMSLLCNFLSYFIGRFF